MASYRLTIDSSIHSFIHKHTYAAYDRGIAILGGGGGKSKIPCDVIQKEIFTLKKNLKFWKTLENPIQAYLWKAEQRMLRGRGREGGGRGESEVSN